MTTVVRFKHKGDFSKTYKVLDRASKIKDLSVLDMYGSQGVNALSAATPVDTGETARSWDYHIEKRRGSVAIVWTNSNINDGCNIAILLQYGHGMPNGAYVQGRDYINPTMRPIFDKIADAAWKEVVG